MCAHWQSEYDASPCSYCEEDRRYSDRVYTLLATVTELSKGTLCGDDIRAALREAVEEFRR